jgi:hypothetical protein
MDYLPSFWILAAVPLASIPIFLLTVTHEGLGAPKEASKIV